MRAWVEWVFLYEPQLFDWVRTRDKCEWAQVKFVRWLRLLAVSGCNLCPLGADCFSWSVLYQADVARDSVAITKVTLETPPAYFCQIFAIFFLLMCLKTILWIVEYEGNDTDSCCLDLVWVGEKYQSISYLFYFVCLWLTDWLGNCFTSSQFFFISDDSGTSQLGKCYV